MDERDADLAIRPGKKQSSPRMRRNAERGRRALELLARGVPPGRIAAELHMHPAALSRLITEALEVRAEREGPRVEAARLIMQDRLEVMVATWLPLSLPHVDPTTGELKQPNAKAAETTLKILALQARISGLEQPMRMPAPTGDAPQTNVNVHVHSAPDPQRAELQVAVLAQLDTVRAKQRTIEGTLARDVTDLGHPDDDDKPGPPAGMERESAA
ncbi:MAG: hypothetical protein ABW067_17375 [Rhizobacter sp.]